MVSTNDGADYIVRLHKGERWLPAFAEFAQAARLDGGFITAIGGVLEVTLGYYDLEKKQYQWQTFKGLREITGIQGTTSLTEAGEPMAHIHGTFSDANYQVIGGHVKDFVAGATVEAYIRRFNKPLQRKHDPDIGLQLLNI